MNKVLGFIELREWNLPTIPWNQYTGKEEFDERYLWTIMSVGHEGTECNLPRFVGRSANEAKLLADKHLSQLGDRGRVIYYPHFVIRKSGTLRMTSNQMIIEAVKGELWNSIIYSEQGTTYVFNDGEKMQCEGNRNFLKESEMSKLLKCVPDIKRIFQDDLLQGKTAVLEWSFAVSCDGEKKQIGNEYLAFYEARAV